MATTETSIKCGGECCRSFPLPYSPDELLGRLKKERKLHPFERTENGHLERVAFMVRPTGEVNAHGRHLYNCIFLEDDGMCSDYENRPKMCRTYPYTSDWGHECEHCGATDGTERRDPEVMEKVKKIRKAWANDRLFRMGFDVQKVDRICNQYGIGMNGLVVKFKKALAGQGGLE